MLVLDKFRLQFVVLLLKGVTYRLSGGLLKRMNMRRVNELKLVNCKVTSR
jgi:hypothetical protein